MIDRYQHRRIQEALRRGEPLNPHDLMDPGANLDRDLYEGPQTLTPDRRRLALISGPLTFLLGFLFLVITALTFRKPQHLAEILPVLLWLCLSSYCFFVGFRVTRNALRSRKK